MPLSQADKNHLNELFDIVGFEGEKGEGDPITESKPQVGTMDTSHSESQSPAETLDADILDLLDEPSSQPSGTSKQSINEVESEIEDDDEDFGFLNEPEKKKSQKSNQQKQQEVDDSPPIETHTLPETISFNLEVSDDQFNATLEKIGELDSDALEEESSYLDEQENKSHRLMSRVKQQKDQDDTPIITHTLPDDLTFNVSIAQDRLSLILKEIGEESSTTTNLESFLDEQENKSRLMSRVKRTTKEDYVPVVSHTLPDKLIFNTQLDDNKVKDLFKALGE